MAAPNIERAFVTGATAGIGKAVAMRLARRGAVVGLVGRNEEAASDVAAQIAAAGGKAIVLLADVANHEQVANAVDSFVAEAGGIDTVVASAGIALTGTVVEMTVTDWSRIIEINLSGAFHTAKYTIPHLLAGGGSFVAISSDAGVTGAQGFAAYCASKHGLIGLVRCLALDHGSRGVRSNVVAPGFVETAMAEQLLADASEADRQYYRNVVPLGRFARPEEVADVVAHLSSAEASYANGMVYSLDGGSTAGYYSPS